MTHQIQSFVNLDVPGFQTIDYSVSGSGGWSTTTIATTGYVKFLDYLVRLTSAVSTEIPSYTFSYDAPTDRVIITPAASTLVVYFRLTNSQALLLGFTDTRANTTTITTAVSAATSGGYVPRGITPAHSVAFTDPTPGNQSRLSQFGSGQARGITFGSGALHKARVLLKYSDLDRFMGGPCSVGRIRIGPTGAGASYSASNPGGHITGHVTKVSPPTSPDTIEGFAEVDLGLHASTYTALDPWLIDGFFNALERGYSMLYFVRIEGIPHTFTQGIDPGWTDSNRPTHTGLIVPDTASIKWRIDRERGVVMSAPIQIGILDPDNDTGLFGLPVKTSEITEAMTDPDQDTLTVDDISAWGGSGAFWLGKEYITYTPAGSPANTFDVVRGSINPLYQFPAGGAAQYTTISDRVLCWAGRVVELFGVVVDAFGNAVGDDWDDSDALIRQMWTGEVAGTVGYDSGVWSLHCTPLVKRLAMELGSEATGVISGPQEHDTYYGGAPADSVAMSPMICINDAELVQIHAQWIPDAEQSKVQDFDPGGVYYNHDTYGATEITAGGPDFFKLVKYYDLIDSVFYFIRSNPYNMNPDPDNSGTNMNTCDWSVYVTEWLTEESEPFRRLFRIWNMAGVWAGQIDPDLRVTIAPGAGNPKWWSLPVSFEAKDTENTGTVGEGGNVDGSPNESGNPRKIATGIHGFNADSVVLTAPEDTQNLIGAWPESGYALLNDQEIISYTHRIISGMTLTAAAETGAPTGMVGLCGVVRGIDGTEPVNAWEPGLSADYIGSIEGSYSTQMLTMIESSGTATRGTYDTESQSDGYGIGTDHVSEDSLENFPQWNTKTLHAKSPSFVKTFGTLIGGMRQAITPIRVGQRLPLGMRRTVPVGLSTVTLTDADLRLDRSDGVSTQRVGLGPNIVKIEMSSAPGLEQAQSKTFRLLADIAARGGIRHTIKVPGIHSTVFNMLAQSMGASYMLGTMGLVAYRMHVGPSKDWLPGQIVDIDITHAGVWDWKADTTGLTALGVILEVTRRQRGECELIILVAGAGNFGALCPAVRVVSRSGSDLTLAGNTFPDGSYIFNEDDPVLLYQAGESANYQETTLTGLSGVVATVNTVPSWLGAGAMGANAGVFVTYPSDDSALIKLSQQRFVHYSDGTVWL